MRDLFIAMVLLTVLGIGITSFYGGLFNSVSSITDIDTSSIGTLNYTELSSNVTKQTEDIKNVLEVRKANILGFDVPYVDIITGGYMVLMMFMNFPNIIGSLLTGISRALPFGDWGWAINSFIVIAFIYIIFEIMSAIFRRKL